MDNIRMCGFCHNQLCLHKVPIFSSLEPEEISKISKLVKQKTFQKGELIFQSGDKLDSMIIINEGSAKAVRYTPDGREQILYVFLEGDFFGEKSLLSSETASYSIEVLKK